MLRCHWGSASVLRSDWPRRRWWRAKLQRGVHSGGWACGCGGFKFPGPLALAAGPSSRWGTGNSVPDKIEACPGPERSKPDDRSGAHAPGPDSVGARWQGKAAAKAHSTISTPRTRFGQPHPTETTDAPRPATILALALARVSGGPAPAVPRHSVPQGHTITLENPACPAQTRATVAPGRVANSRDERRTEERKQRRRPCRRLQVLRRP
jgi:hypothetical protein